MTARSAKPGAKSGAKPMPSRVCGSIFQADPDVPADPLTGDVYCRCGLAGKPGDAHHPPLPHVPEQAVVASRYEHEDGGER